MNRWTRTILGMAVVLGITGAESARASLTTTWQAIQSGSDGGLGAQAVITTSTNTVTVTLTNLVDPNLIKSAGQALSGIQFTLGNATTTTTAQLQSQTPPVNPLYNITTSSVTLDNSLSSLLRWLKLGSISSDSKTVTLQTLGNDHINGNNNQAAMILPSASSFPSANASLTGHDPYGIGPQTFTITLAGVTENTTVSGVFFSFGTEPDTTLPGSRVNTVPEPSTVALAVSAFGLTGLMTYRRRNRSGAATA